MATILVLLLIFIVNGYSETLEQSVIERLTRLELVQTQTIAQQNIKILRLEENLSIMQKTVDMIKEKCSVLENQYTSNDEMKRIIPPGSQPVVAFYAYMSHNEVPGSNDKLVFDKIKTNEQGGYDGLSGIFTAPVQGLYGFTFSIRMGCHAYGSFQIIKNGSVEGVVKLDGQEACDSEETSMTAILSLAKGDNVFIRTHTNGLNGEISGFHHLLGGFFHCIINGKCENYFNKTWNTLKYCLFVYYHS